MQNADAKKYIVLSLAAGLTIGVIGFKSFTDYLNPPQPIFLKADNPNERLHLELNHLKSNLNEMRRLLYVKNNAVEPSDIRKMKKELAEKERLIAELSELIQKQEAALAEEKIRIATLSGSITTLNDRLDVQKDTQTRELEEANQAIGALQEQIAYIEEEKKSVITALQYGAELQDALAIKTVLGAMQRLELDQIQTALKEQKMEIEFAHFKAENETQLKDEANDKLYNLEKHHLKELQEVGYKGSHLEEVIAFENTLHALQKRDFKKNQASFDDTLVFERLKNTLEQEKLNVELEDLAYALITAVQKTQTLDEAKQKQELELATLEALLKNAEERLQTTATHLDNLADAYPALESELKQAAASEAHLREYIDHLEEILESQETLAKEQSAHLEKITAIYSELAEQMAAKEEPPKENEDDKT